MDTVDAAVAWNDLVKFSGLALPPREASEMNAEQGGAKLALRWGQVSVGGPKLFGPHPQASRARFGPFVARADPAQPVTWSWQDTFPEAPRQLAQVRFIPLTARQAVPGWLRNDCGVGLIAIPATGCIIVAAAIQSDAPSRDDLAQRLTDVSGIPNPFTLITDPVHRFLTLWRRHGKGHSLEQFELRLEELSEGMPWAREITSQSSRVRLAKQAEIFSWRQPEHAEQWLSARLQRQIFLPRPQRRNLFDRWGWGEVSRSMRQRITSRYIEDMEWFHHRGPFTMEFRTR